MNYETAVLIGTLIAEESSRKAMQEVIGTYGVNTLMDGALEELQAATQRKRWMGVGQPVEELIRDLQEVERD